MASEIIIPSKHFPETPELSEDSRLLRVSMQECRKGFTFNSIEELVNTIKGYN